MRRRTYEVVDEFGAAYNSPTLTINEHNYVQSGSLDRYNDAFHPDSMGYIYDDLSRGSGPDTVEFQEFTATNTSGLNSFSNVPVMIFDPSNPNGPYFGVLGITLRQHDVFINGSDAKIDGQLHYCPLGQLMHTAVLKSVLRVFLAVVILLSASCSPVPKLVPHLANAAIGEQINRANVIVIGIAEDERAVRTVASASKPESMPLQLRAVRVRVEGVLEGLFNGERLTFYYYQTTGAWDGPPMNILSPEERAIFYLISDRGVLRATTDMYLSHTRLVSGRHNISPVVGKDQARAAITRVLLVPGDGAEVQRNLAVWRQSLAVALSLVPQTEVVKILHKDFENPNYEVRGRACLLLAEFPINEKGCLPSVANDGRILPEDRKRAKELMLPN